MSGRPISAAAIVLVAVAACGPTPTRSTAVVPSAEVAEVPAEEALAPAEIPSTSPAEFGETPPPAEHRLLFEGLVVEEALDAFAIQQPGVFFSLPPFPEPGPRLGRLNPLGLPPAVRRRIARVTPEVRIWGTNQGLSVERRGWRQVYSARSPDGGCAVLFDYRVSVVDARLASNTTFGRINRPFELIQVLTPPPAGRSGLYVLVIATVEINSKRVGTAFTESNTAIINRRAGTNPPRPTTIARMPRWFIVEHELTHAEQIRRAYEAVVDGVVRDQSLCRPTRPIVRHRALVDRGFDTTWMRLTSGGEGGDHNNPNYPDTPGETEARDAAWSLFDARRGP